jgi:hypothetical protein
MNSHEDFVIAACGRWFVDDPHDPGFSKFCDTNGTHDARELIVRAVDA